jgi:hypothetical protein
MKKFVYVSVLALASLGLLVAPTLRAQDQITIKDPAEFNAYQNSITQSDPHAKAAALESFLQTYPQSVVKGPVLDTLVDTYQALNEPDKTLSAATRLLQIEPDNMKAIFISVFIQKNQCGKTQNAQTCDDAAALANKGLTVQKPAAVTDEQWKQQTAAAYPVFHSAIAWDDALAKKDYKSAIEQYRAELMLYNDEQSKTAGLVDTLQLAEAYTKPGVRDLVLASWFYARAWNYFPAAYKAKIEQQLEYYYKTYHGGLDGLNELKQQAAATTFPPGTFKIAPAKSPAEQIHDLIAATPDLNTLALADKETVLALGTKDDADKLWALLKDKPTPVPGTVIATAVSQVKVSVTERGKVKPSDFVVNMKAPIDCKTVPAADADVKTIQTFIQTNGVPDDTAKLGTLLTDDATRIRKIELEPDVTAIRMAVTQDAKNSSVPDFIVNLKAPTACKDVPAAGSDFGIQPAVELDGTYDTYRQIPASSTSLQRAEIVLRDGVVVPAAKEKKRPVARKPAPGRRRAR